MSEQSHAATVAALYVKRGGVYWDLPGVDAWDEERDARLYAGPWPVVAHPPCNRWCALAGMIETRYGYKVGDDGGCFAAALESVQRFGGVLEHPAHSKAWDAFGLPEPAREGWAAQLDGLGWSCEVDQGNYGHPLAKTTWLYVYGIDPPPMRWGPSGGRTLPHRDAGLSASQRERMTIPTPVEFRDVLLAMARSARIEVAA